MMDDVNVAADMAMCRACGYSGPFLKRETVPEISDEEMARPPKRITLRREFGDALSILIRPKRWVLVFLIPFTALWSGVSMTGIYIAPLLGGNFDWKMGLFGLPFLLGTVVLVTTILFYLVGRTVITLSKGRVRIHSGFFGFGRTRNFECGPDTQVSLQLSNVRVNNVQQREIVLTSGGRKMKFGAMMLDDGAREYVAAVLRRASGGG